MCEIVQSDTWRNEKERWGSMSIFYVLGVLGFSLSLIMTCMTCVGFYFLVGCGWEGLNPNLCHGEYKWIAFLFLDSLSFLMLIVMLLFWVGMGFSIIKESVKWIREDCKGTCK